MISDVKFKLLCISGLMTLPISSFSQSNETIEEEELIITGTSVARAAFSTPLSVTTFNEDQLRRLTSSSQADILRTVPGIRPEGSGGEAAANVRVRGLPATGQFQFTPLQYDGIPTISTFGLNDSAHDIYYRNDLGIERLEFVRAGVSNLFGAGSVAGVINYISKTGSDDPESTLQYEIAEEGRYRADFATNGPLNTSGVYYALSGFYRFDKGPIESGLDTDGYQLRGNLKKEFTDDSGSFTIYAQHIDDRTQFFLPLPVDGDSLEQVNGNDGEEVETLNTLSASRISYPLPDGNFQSPVEDGIVSKGSSIAFALDKALSDTWTLNAKARWMRNAHEFNLFLPDDALQGDIPLSLEAYLDTATIGPGGATLGTEGVDDLVNARFTYANSGEELDTDDLVIGSRLLDRPRPITDATSELNLTKIFRTGSFEHAVTVGTYFARGEASNAGTRTTSYLTDFTNSPDLVNLEFDGITYSLNGLVNASSFYQNTTNTISRQAFYIADQFENDRWVFDIGARFESVEITQVNEISTEYDVSDAPQYEALNLGDLITTVADGSGTFQRGSVNDSATAISLAALYRITNNINIFANVSDGFFFPEGRNVQFDPLGNTAPYKEESITQGELGARWSSDQLDASLTFFFIELSDRISNEFVNAPGGGIINNITTQDAESSGVEVDIDWILSDSLALDFTVSYEDHEFTRDTSAPEIEGNELQRKPNLLANAGITFDNGVFDMNVSWSHTGEAFANDSNTLALDAYDVFRLDLGYTWELGDDQTMRLGLNIWNLTDDQGLTEGNPRAGNSQTSGDFVVGRPILPRRAALRLTYDF